jgi:predicted esterase
MPYTSFQQLAEKMVEHFQNKEYAQALELILAEGDNFPDDRMDADYWKMVSAARVDNRKLLFDVAHKSLADGLWYGEFLWRQSPSYAPLQGDPEFEQIVAESLEAQKRDMPSEPVVITKFPTNHSDQSPLLIALHGNQSSAEKTRPFWEPAVGEGWVTVIPQSNQAMQKNALGWDGLDTSFAYVKERFERLDMPFDSKRVVIAGHSMGGFVAIRMALEGMLPVCGFIVNGPAVPYLDEEAELEKILPQAKARGLRAYFILGEKDDAIFIPKVIELADKIKAAGIACEVEMVPDSTHDHNPMYDPALRRALAFVGG